MNLYDSDNDQYEIRDQLSLNEHLKYNRPIQTDKEVFDCPLCGGLAELTQCRIGGVSFGVRCKNINCGVGAFAFSSRKEALKAWNKRV